jgi:hypothetical protein
MEATVSAALIGGAVALAGAYATNFAAHSYRNFRDGSTIAAALAGELATYFEAYSILRPAFAHWIEAIDSGQREVLVFRSFERPKDMVFPEYVDRLGLLGPSLVEDVLYVYGNIGGLRVGQQMVNEHYRDMSDAELRARLGSCLDAMNRAVTRGAPLLAALRLRAAQHFLLR